MGDLEAIYRCTWWQFDPRWNRGRYAGCTVLGINFDNPPATMTTYAAALDDALSTFKAVGASAALPQLFSDLAHKGLDAGLNDKALTALVQLLGDDRR
jgi:hypothetical protein